ncbi:MAG: tRNA (5-methylaminomethyl-2-thiouridine)(34)-methyltransferase MnmD [Bacteroidota bacterium]
MPDKLELITTSDGSHSLLNSELNETYHSVHGAIQESIHVFINNGLDYFEQKNRIKEVRILEVGFGTGLNALLTLQYSLDHARSIYYETLEAFPIDQKTASQLNYPSALDFPDAEKYFIKLHQSLWNQQIAITNEFSIVKHHVKIQDIQLGSEKFDVIYFDAFAPSKQPDMWELSILKKIARAIKPGGVFVTYCAKGQLKRDLKSLNLLVETLDGPPGKKEMVRAVKP